jgi:hypothetical protein
MFPSNHAFLGKLALLALFVLPLAGGAQELREQSTPSSVWLDFHRLQEPTPPKLALPLWLESVKTEQAMANGEAVQTLFRMRLRHVGTVNRQVQLRLYFEDLPGATPSVSTWTETGAPLFQAGPLGNALGLPTSESVVIPVNDADYIDVTVPGDASGVRGAFVTTAELVETREAVDFGGTPRIIDPFGNPPPAAPSENDNYLFGRIKATLQTEAAKIEPDAPLLWDLQVAELPLLAVLSFEVLDAQLDSPPQVKLNGHNLGPASLQLPDLADLAYRGEVLPRSGDLRFQYTGWLHAQVIIRGSAFTVGLNNLVLALRHDARNAAIRSVELQLKHNSPSFDYTVSP